MCPCAVSNILYFATSPQLCLVHVLCPQLQLISRRFAPPNDGDLCGRVAVMWRLLLRRVGVGFRHAAVVCSRISKSHPLAIQRIIAPDIELYMVTHHHHTHAFEIKQINR